MFVYAAFAQEPGQQTFASADDAGPRFLCGMQAKNEQALLSILGPAGKEVPLVRRRGGRFRCARRFVVNTRRCIASSPSRTARYPWWSAPENWPLPIPLVNHNGSWYFDTDAGKDEILFPPHWRQ